MVCEDGTFEGINLAQLDELNRDISEYAENMGLFGTFLPTEKLSAVNPSLCSLLLIDYAYDMELFKVLNRLIVRLLVADDIWEQEQFHE